MVSFCLDMQEVAEKPLLWKGLALETNTTQFCAEAAAPPLPAHSWSGTVQTKKNKSWNLQASRARKMCVVVRTGGEKKIKMSGVKNSDGI